MYTRAGATYSVVVLPLSVGHPVRSSGLRRDKWRGLSCDYKFARHLARVRTKYGRCSRSRVKALCSRRGDHTSSSPLENQIPLPARPQVGLRNVQNSASLLVHRQFCLLSYFFEVVAPLSYRSGARVYMTNASLSIVFVACLAFVRLPCNH